MSRQYSEQQQQRLKELLNASQKALKLANTYYEQANSSYQSCNVSAQKLESAQLKFELVSSELSKQIQVFFYRRCAFTLQISEQIVHTVRARVQHFSITVSQLGSSSEEVTHVLEDVFAKLKVNAIRDVLRYKGKKD